MEFKLITPLTAGLVVGLVYLSGMISAGNHYTKEAVNYQTSLAAKRDSVKVQVSQIEQIISKTKPDRQKNLLSQKKDLVGQIERYQASIDSAKDEKNKAVTFAKSFLSWGYLAEYMKF